MKRAALALVVACVGASALAACSRSSIQSGSARLSFERAARVQITDGGAGFRTVDGGVTLHTGDKVRVLSGEADLQLPHGAQLLLRKGSQVIVGPEPTVTAGDVVADVSDEPLTLRAADSSVTARKGATRLRAGLALTAGVYSGSARVESAGRSLVVPALRQASVVTFGVVPALPSPLEYRVTGDPWDLRFLGVAIDIGEELQNKSDGFTDQLRSGEGLTPGFYTRLLPELPGGAFAGCPAALQGSLGEGRRPGEVLAGTTLSLLGRAGSFTSRCKDAFAFRDAGATWGLVALDQGVRSLPGIRQQWEVAIGRLPADANITAVAPPASAAPQFDVAAPPAVAEPTTSSPPAPSTPANPAPGTPTPTPEPVPGVPPAPTLPPTPDPTGGLLTPVTDVVDNLLGGLLG